MSKDMYDEKGLLKPEFEMTDTQRKSMLYNNNFKTNENNISATQTIKNEMKQKTNREELILKEKLNKSLTQMQKDVMYNKISLGKFEEYFILITGGIATGILKNPLASALSLTDAEVFPITNKDDEEKYYVYINELKDIIAKEIRKSLGKDALILQSQLNGLIKTLTQYTLTLKEYCNLCEKLQYAIMGKIDYLDYLECAKALQNAKVESPKAYHEYVKLHNYQKKIATIISNLEKPEKEKTRK